MAITVPLESISIMCTNTLEMCLLRTSDYRDMRCKSKTGRMRAYSDSDSKNIMWQPRAVRLVRRRSETRSSSVPNALSPVQGAKLSVVCRPYQSNPSSSCARVGMGTMQHMFASKRFYRLMLPKLLTPKQPLRKRYAVSSGSLIRVSKSIQMQSHYNLYHH